jgi:hypothetical protein
MCWFNNAAPAPVDRLTVYRATLPASLVNGNGTYRVALSRGGSGLVDGQDPWLGPLKPPLAEGASLVVVGTGEGIVAIYDDGLSGLSLGGATSFSGAPNYGGSTTYLLPLPLAVSPEANNRLIWHSIAADGQTGGGTGESFNGLVDYAAVSFKQTKIFGLDGSLTQVSASAVAGVGGFDGANDFNGNTSTPLPRLWDDTAHDITQVILPTGGAFSVSYLEISVLSTAGATVIYGEHPATKVDCFGAVANIVEIH